MPCGRCISRGFGERVSFDSIVNQYYISRERQLAILQRQNSDLPSHEDSRHVCMQTPLHLWEFAACRAPSSLITMSCSAGITYYNIHEQ